MSQRPFYLFNLSLFISLLFCQWSRAQSALGNQVQLPPPIPYVSGGPQESAESPPPNEVASAPPLPETIFYQAKDGAEISVPQSACNPMIIHCSQDNMDSDSVAYRPKLGEIIAAHPDRNSAGGESRVEIVDSSPDHSFIATSLQTDNFNNLSDHPLVRLASTPDGSAHRLGLSSDLPVGKPLLDCNAKASLCFSTDQEVQVIDTQLVPVTGPGGRKQIHNFYLIAPTDNSSPSAGAWVDSEFLCFEGKACTAPSLQPVTPPPVPTVACGKPGLPATSCPFDYKKNLLDSTLNEAGYGKCDASRSHIHADRPHEFKSTLATEIKPLWEKSAQVSEAECQKETIDALARTIYGEMASCHDHPQYLNAVAAVVLNRVDAVRASASGKAPPLDDPFVDTADTFCNGSPSGDILKVLASERQFDTWDRPREESLHFPNPQCRQWVRTGSTFHWRRRHCSHPSLKKTVLVANQPLMQSLCPPIDKEAATHALGKEDKVPTDDEIQAWKQSLLVATEAVTNPEEFKKRSQIKALFYTSNVNMNACHFSPASGSFDHQRISDPVCMQLWNARPKGSSCAKPAPAHHRKKHRNST